MRLNFRGGSTIMIKAENSVFRVKLNFRPGAGLIIRLDPLGTHAISCPVIATVTAKQPGHTDAGNKYLKQSVLPWDFNAVLVTYSLSVWGDFRSSPQSLLKIYIRVARSELFVPMFETFVLGSP
jgi:hypothetical protein